MHSRNGSLSGAAAASESGASGFELDFESDDDASCVSGTPHSRVGAPPRGALRRQNSSAAGLSRVNAEVEALRAEIAHLQALWRDAQPAAAPAPLARAPARARSASPDSSRDGGSPRACAHADAATSVSPPDSPPRHVPLPVAPAAAAAAPPEQPVRLLAAAREALHAPVPAALPAQTPAATPVAQTPAPPASASSAPIRLLGAELAAAAPPLSTPAAPPRVLDMHVPSLQKQRPAGDASTLRLLQRPPTTTGGGRVPGSFDVTRAPGAHPCTQPGAQPVTLLSAEALHIKDSFDAAVAATEARLRAALGEALRESTNLRLAARAPQQPAHTHAEAMAGAARRDARLARANAADGAGDSSVHVYAPHARAHAHAAAHEPEDASVCRSRAELEDPFVPLWQWAGGRPARLADLFRDAEPAGAADGLPRSTLSRLVASLAPVADARALRYVVTVLDADGAPDVVPLSAFVHAVREGASAGAATRAHFHAGLHDTLGTLRRSMEAQPEAWSFQFRCAEGGALSLSQLLAAAMACVPQLSARQRVLLAAHAHAEGSYGGPRLRFTLQQAMRMCVPRAERGDSAGGAAGAPRRVPPSALAHARAHPPPALTVELPLPPPPPPPPPSAAGAAASARAHLARRKRAQAEAAATAALAAAAAAAAATSVVRIELQRVQHAQQQASPSAAILPYKRDDNDADVAAEASLADLHAYTLPPPHVPAAGGDSPQREEAAHAVDVAHEMAAWRDDAAAAADDAPQEAHAAPSPPHVVAAVTAAPDAAAARAQEEREAGAAEARARARALLQDARAALQAVAADADALRGDIASEMRMVSQARVQLRGRGGGAQPKRSPPPSARGRGR
jgi:hypothetical protein